MAHIPPIVAGLTLLFESPPRQAEIAIYCISKGWETAYTMLKRRQYPVVVPMGNLLINAVSLAVLTFGFMNDSSVLREGYRNAIGLILNDI